MEGRIEGEFHEGEAPWKKANPAIIYTYISVI